jgi:hypothetical protein
MSSFSSQTMLMRLLFSSQGTMASTGRRVTKKKASASQAEHFDYIGTQIDDDKIVYTEEQQPSQHRKSDFSRETDKLARSQSSRK